MNLRRGLLLLWPFTRQPTVLLDEPRQSGPFGSTGRIGDTFTWFGLNSPN
jgi:hypothetical protein